MILKGKLTLMGCILWSRGSDCQQAASVLTVGVWREKCAPGSYTAFLPPYRWQEYASWLCLSAEKLRDGIIWEDPGRRSVKTMSHTQHTHYCLRHVYTWHNYKNPRLLKGSASICQLQMPYRAHAILYKLIVCAHSAVILLSIDWIRIPY